MKLKKIIVPLILGTVLSVSSVNVFADTTYPITSYEKEQNGYMTISKTYALTEDENPDDIDKLDFERYGMTFTLQEVIKKDTTTQDVVKSTEVVEKQTSTNEVSKVIGEFEDTIEVERNGYKGVLSLDVKTITSSASGKKTSYGTQSITKNYYNLESQDLSQFPKTVTENGATYTFGGATFSSNTSSNIDNNQINSSVNAKVTYTRGTSNTYVTGYTTTATYTGELTKLVKDKTLYTVTFMQKDPVVFIEVDADLENGSNVLNENEIKNSINVKGISLKLLYLLIIGGIIAGLSIVASKIASHNVTVFNSEGRDFRQVAKLVLNLSKPELFVNLNHIPKEKITSTSFVLEIPKNIAKRIEGKTVYIIYKDNEVEHIVQECLDNKYQIEADFYETSMDIV